MAILLISTAQNGDEWRAAMAELLPGVALRVWPDVGEPAEIDMALVWKAPVGVLEALPNLRCVCSLGQGVDHLFVHDDLPEGVAVVRLIDASMRRQISAYALAAVLRRLCRMEGYAALQAERGWEPLDAHDPAETRVGVMGLGALGGDLARKLAGLEFRVAGWSRTRKEIAGVETFAGRAGLAAFLADCDIVCCLLPLTPETRGILNAETFASMKQGAYLVNVARGGHLVEADLIAALRAGRLSGATLDVFETEPLPPSSPLWSEPGVTITPHISAVTLVRSCAPQVAENHRRLQAGKPLLNRISLDRGY